MKRKTVSGIMLILLFIGMLTLAFNIQPVKAESLPYMRVDPPTATIQAVGEKVTITVNVNNVVNLYGWDFKLTYNDALLEKVSITVVGANQVAPPQPANYTLTDVSVPGTIIFGCAFFEYHGAVPFNGTGVLAWITFKGLTGGVSNLSFVEDWTFLWDPDGVAIPRDPCVGGEITVIAPPPVGGKATPINIPINKPETPTLWIWLTTIILSLAVTVVYVKKRKRQ